MDRGVADGNEEEFICVYQEKAGTHWNLCEIYAESYPTFFYFSVTFVLRMHAKNSGCMTEHIMSILEAVVVVVS